MKNLRVFFAFGLLDFYVRAFYIESAKIGFRVGGARNQLLVFLAMSVR